MYLSSNTLILDIETDGLNPTKIWWCSSNLFSTVFSEEEFKDALATIEVDTIVAHNGIAFDFPVLQKLWNIDLSSYQLLDSLILSRLASPSREEAIAYVPGEKDYAFLKVSILNGSDYRAR